MIKVIAIILFFMQIVASKPTHVFGMFGQSNMVGYGGASYLTAHDSCFMWNGTAWVHLVDPMSYQRSLAPALGNYLVANYDSTVSYGFINCAVASKGIVDTWSDSASVERLAAQVKVDNAGGCDDIFFWAGEQDIADSRTQDAVTTAATTMITSFRYNYGANIPIYFVCPYRTTDAARSDTIRAALISLRDTANNVYVVISAEFANVLHLQADSLDTVGMALAYAWMTDQGYKRPMTGRTTGSYFYRQAVIDNLYLPQNYDHFPVAYDLNNLTSDEWALITDANDIAVYDQAGDSAVAKYAILNTGSSKGVLLFDGNMNLITGGFFTIEIGSGINVANSSAVGTNSGYTSFYPGFSPDDNEITDICDANDGTISSALLISAPISNGFKATTLSEHIDCGASFLGTSNLSIDISYRIDSLNAAGTMRLVTDERSVLAILSGDWRLRMSRNGATFTTAAVTDSGIWVRGLMTSTSAGVTNFYIRRRQSGTVNGNAGSPTAPSVNMGMLDRVAGGRTFNGALQGVGIKLSVQDNPVHWEQINNSMWIDNDLLGVNDTNNYSTALDTIRKKYGYYVEPIKIYTTDAGYYPGTIMLNSIVIDSIEAWCNDSVSGWFTQSQQSWIPKGWYNTVRVITAVGDTVTSTYPTRNIRYYVLRPSVVNP